MKLSLSKIVLLFLISLRTEAQPCFTTMSYFPTGDTPRAITTGDYNGDGNNDIATANDYGKSISVLFGDGLGNFAAPVNYTFTNNTNAIASGDFNNDGKPDLVASQTNNSLKILTNDGTGNFTSVLTATMSGSAYSLLATDIDSDNDIDIITANDTWNNICVLKNNGSGSFPVAVSYLSGTNPKGLISGDFNNDGFKDLAVASSGSNYVHIFKGVSTGTFAAMTSFTTGVNPNCITAADFNNDGIIDLATASGTANKVSILKGSGTATFAVIGSYAVTQAPVTITTGDFNGDGIADLATSNSNYNSGIDNASFLIGTGVGTFTYTGILLGQQTDDALSITNADFNNDGHTDIATANNTSSNCTIILLCGGVTTGAIEKYSDHHINVYPNPGKGVFIIESTTLINNIKIYDQLGTEVYNKYFDNKTAINLDTEELPQGLYFIKINGNESDYKKLVITY